MIKRLARIIIILTYVGWISYPGWFNCWYSTWPEKYAYPASLSKPSDPPWGFWYW